MADPANSGGTDDSTGSVLLGVLWSLAGVSAIILALRLYTAAFVLRRVKLHDYLTVAALICVIIQSAFLTASVHWGLGRHVSYLGDVEVVYTMKFVTLCQGWGVASAMFGRIAFCLYLLQFAGTSRIHKMVLYVLIGSQAFVNMLTIILIYVQCGAQVEALWDHSIAATCWSPLVQRDFGFFQSALNSLADLFLTILPATLVWNMTLTGTKKLGVSILLGASLFAFIGSIVKTYMIKEIGETDDLTWKLASFSIWAATESYIVVIGASIPTLSALFRRGKRSATSQRGYDMGGSHYTRREDVAKALRPRASVEWRQLDDAASDLGRGGTGSQEQILDIPV